MSPDVLLATPDDRARVVATLVAAFRTDPAVRWMFPDDTFDAHFTTFAGSRFDRRMPLGAVWTVDGGAAVAMWSPPGGDGGNAAEAYPAAVSERLAAYDAAVHDALPTGEHWYLGMLAVDPQFAGKGWGRAAMRPGLERAARDGMPIYLETSNPRNVGIYRGAGWNLIAETSVPDLPIWIMQHG
jgi:ribosomal protein S18 acetylase RimI-like enzyme